jgi:hypothetical protein
MTNTKIGGLGFHIHPGFVLDAESLMPYGFSKVKNRGDKRRI